MANQRVENHESEIIAAEVVETSDSGHSPSPNEKLAASRWQVLVLLFLAAGPLALPVLARSPRFSRFWKGVLFVLVIFQTILVVVIVILFSRWMLGQFEQARQFYG